jgi:hypothetical protein
MIGKTLSLPRCKGFPGGAFDRDRMNNRRSDRMSADAELDIESS